MSHRATGGGVGPKMQSQKPVRVPPPLPIKQQGKTKPHAPKKQMRSR